MCINRADVPQIPLPFLQRLFIYHQKTWSKWPSQSVALLISLKGRVVTQEEQSSWTSFCWQMRHLITSITSFVFCLDHPIWFLWSSGRGVLTDRQMMRILPRGISMWKTLTFHEYQWICDLNVKHQINRRVSTPSLPWTIALPLTINTTDCDYSAVTNIHLWPTSNNRREGKWIILHSPTPNLQTQEYQ